jgi:hypothetical protein
MKNGTDVAEVPARLRRYSELVGLDIISEAEGDEMLPFLGSI